MPGTAVVPGSEGAWVTGLADIAGVVGIWEVGAKVDDDVFVLGGGVSPGAWVTCGGELAAEQFPYVEFVESMKLQLL